MGRRRGLATLLAALVVGVVAPAVVHSVVHPVVAAEPDTGIRNAVAVTVASPAQPVWSAPEIVTVVNRANALSPTVVERSMTAAQASYGSWSVARSFSVGMHAVRRGPAMVQEAPNGYEYTMSVSALPASTIAQLMGRGMAGIVTSGYVVMGSTTASLRGAQVGDALDLVSADGPVVQLIVGAVVDDGVIGGAEILMSTEQADALGAGTNTRMIIWGFRSRDLIELTLGDTGLLSMADVKVRRSWDPFDPDSSIALATVKAQLGEFAYRVRPDGVDVDVTAAWAERFLPADREVLTAAIPVRARCNLSIVGDLRAALDEVAAAGLAGEIHVSNANAYGGCYYPRFNRLSGTLGVLSRHSWGQAFDTNTTTNVQGGSPMMNCAVVRIFRKHNFAWGGNFLTPDGMHVEWVGSRRDLYAYPSKYCPNVAAPGAAGTESTTARVAPSASPDPAPSSADLGTMLVDDQVGGG